MESFLERERGQLPSWLVVGFGAGIASWFALDGRSEWLAVLCLSIGLAIAGFVFEDGRLARAIGWLRACGGVWMRPDLAAFRMG